MGTHTRGPSHVSYQDTNGNIVNKLLSDWIKDNPVLAMGKKIANQYQNQLPFLFKGSMPFFLLLITEVLASFIY